MKIKKSIIYIVLLILISLTIQAFNVKAATKTKISYTTHVQNIGWQNYVSDGAMAGTSGKSLRLEGIQIKLENQEYDGNVKYKTHVQNIGWETDYRKNDEMSGTQGKSYRLEAIKIKLDGGMNEKYDVYYRVHAENFGWLGWARNDEPAGTEGYAYRLEGIEIKLIPKNQAFPEYGKTQAFRNKNANKLISYTTHVQNIGWQSYVSDGTMAGTSGKSLRLEGIKIKLENQKYDGNVLYRTHIQNIGWETSFKKNNEMSGTSGRSLRLEAIEIKLDGSMKEHYDVYYRVHAENFGWLGWAKNGEQAGTAGYSYRLEGIEIKLVEKETSFPDYGKDDAFDNKYPVTKVSLDTEDKIIVMKKDNSYKITPTITPSNATDKTLIWTSSDPSVATVDNGRITALKQGITKITAKSTNGKKSTCTVAVLLASSGKDDISLTANEAKANTKTLNRVIDMASTGVHKIYFVTNAYYHFFISEDDTYPEDNKEIPYQIILKSDVTLNFNNSKVVMYPYDAHGNAINAYRYYIMDMTNVSNVQLYEGRIIGDREYHNYDTNYGDGLDTHEWGMGINIKDSKQIVIEDMQIYSTTGDGIIIKDSMSYNENTCEEINQTSGILIHMNKIHDVRRDGISIIAGSNINIIDNEIYNIGNQYTHKDGTKKDGTSPKAGINLERNMSETCGYTLLDENDQPVLNNKGEPKKRQQIEEFIRNVTIQNNELYNNGNEQDITYLNGVYNLKVTGNKLEKRIGINVTYNCDAPAGGTYTGVNRCYQGDNITRYTQNTFKNQFGFVIKNNTDRTGLHQDTINTMYNRRDPNVEENLCCKSFRSNNKCQQPKYNPYNICKKQ